VSAVLVLTPELRALNVCNARRALVLVDGGKAEVLENAKSRSEREIVCSRGRPSSGLVYMIKRPRPRVRLTRREIFIRRSHASPVLRDPHTRSHPGPRGAAPSWRGATPGQPGERARSCNQPQRWPHARRSEHATEAPAHEPHATSYYLFHQYLESERFQGWTKFMPAWEKDRK